MNVHEPGCLLAHSYCIRKTIRSIPGTLTCATGLLITMVVSELSIIRIMLYTQYAMNNPLKINFDTECKIAVHKGSPTLLKYNH